MGRGQWIGMALAWQLMAAGTPATPAASGALIQSLSRYHAAPSLSVVLALAPTAPAAALDAVLMDPAPPMLVKVHAIASLESLASPAAGAILRRRLADPETHPRLRLAAVLALGRAFAADNDILTTLAAAASGDLDGGVRRAALVALSRLPGGRGRPLMAALARQSQDVSRHAPAAGDRQTDLGELP